MKLRGSYAYQSNRWSSISSWITLIIPTFTPCPQQVDAIAILLDRYDHLLILFWALDGSRTIYLSTMVPLDEMRYLRRYSYSSAAASSYMHQGISLISEAT